MSGEVTHLFQELPPDEPCKKKETKKGVWSGPDRRGEERLPGLSNEHQNLVNAIGARLGNCRKNCVIPKEIQDMIPQMSATLYKIGEGNLHRGWDRMEAVYSESADIIKTIKDTKKKAWSTFIWFLVVAILGTLGVGFLSKVKG